MKLDSTPPTKINNPLFKSLCCVALEPKLRSILLFDISPVSLQQIAGVLASLLKITTEFNHIIPIQLGTTESEDDLWGEVGLTFDSKKSVFQWQSGLLGKTKPDEIRLIIIPDLTKLSLPAMRACVVLMGADVAYLERHGEKQNWQPNLCWLVGCKQQEIGAISPHLLDRFCLRLNGQFEENTNRVRKIQQLLNQEIKPEDLLFQEREIDADIQQWLKQVSTYQPKIEESVFQRILAYTSDFQIYHRREIILARFARSYAQLEGKQKVTIADVNNVAKIMSLRLKQNNDKTNQNQSNSSEDESLDENKDKLEKQRENGNNKTNTSKKSPIQEIPYLSQEEKKEPVYQSNQNEIFSDIFPENIKSLTNTYSEDDAPIDREIDSLKLPTRFFKSKAIARGTIIGVEKTCTLTDLAIVKTILEAIKFKKIRQKNMPNYSDNLRILPTDLYCYRRQPVAEQMLMILIDYTCLDYCKWEEQLFPYLSWAYTQRASVGIIQVGVLPEIESYKKEEKNNRISSEELRAKKISAQKILVSSISKALDLEKTKKAKATPLAHGLDIALMSLRHALQHGKDTLQEAVFVVISDGRGNIPLQASQTGKIQLPVGRNGVEDAIEIAEKIGNLDNVKTIFLNPQRKHCRELPLFLAKALKAKVINIPLNETWEVIQ